MAGVEGVTFSGVAKGFLARSLDHPPFEVLPYVPRAWLEDAVRRLTAEDIALALRHKIIPVSWIPTLTMYAVATEDGLRLADARGLRVVARVRPEDFRAAVRKCLGAKLLDAAVWGLARKAPTQSAHRRMTLPQALIFVAGAALLTVGALAGGLYTIIAALTLWACVFFAGVVALRLYCLLPERSVGPRAANHRAVLNWPVYTVLVPLFRETAVLGQLMQALCALDYPSDRLDIKLILEEEDAAMQRALARLPLPPWFDIIIVPSGKPQTKPRALNYALQFSRGSLITIFDSEDIPRPAQLKKAALRFEAAPPELACLQAALVFYNSRENWLTRQFAAEYAALFKVILPALAADGLPFLLGGTSNHFRASALASVGGWDPFNVTEDADLGIRLARAGFTTDVLASETYEEANTQFVNWMKQRRRWLKGFLQTWLVHMRHPAALARELGWRGFFTVQCMTLGVFGSALLHPLLLGYSLLSLSEDNLRLALAHPATAVLAGANLAFLVAGYGAAMAASALGLARLGQAAGPATLLTVPVYWLMMSAAAWMALWDFAVRPFHWHKTQHGLSRLGHGRVDDATSRR